MSLENEFKYFKENQVELLEKYEGKFLVIKDLQVQGAYNSEFEAYTEGQKKFQLGSFLIQQCLPGKESYTQTYHSQVSFA